MDEKQKILVTGFGPFRSHTINPSWGAVQLLQDQTRYNLPGFEIITSEIAVQYAAVSSLIPKLWQLHKPILVVHVGVSHLTRELRIEQCAHKCGYNQLDCTDAVHPTGSVCSVGPDCIRTSIDVDRLCQLVKSNTNVKCSSSADAGRYLCEYIYYTSLKIDQSKSLFVHVPLVDEPYSSEQVADALFHIIKCIVQS